VVGVIGYNQIDQDLGKVTIGYWLAERWQGHGIITRACQALIHHAFEEMGMEKVRSAPPSRTRRAGPCASGWE
jgi:ribosomal-protein-serine acetyltransferase